MGVKCEPVVREYFMGWACFYRLRFGENLMRNEGGFYMGSGKYLNLEGIRDEDGFVELWHFFIKI